MVVWCTQNLRRDGSSFTWHQPCQRCKSLFGDYLKTRYKKLVMHSCRITCERSESARERRIALYKSDHHQQQQHFQLPHRHCSLMVHYSSPQISARMAQHYTDWSISSLNWTLLYASSRSIATATVSSVRKIIMQQRNHDKKKKKKKKN